MPTEMGHSYNPSTEAETGGLLVLSQPGLRSKTLSQSKQTNKNMCSQNGKAC
jgi:hypothetical protein